jgi:hypothetical protein
MTTRPASTRPRSTTGCGPWPSTSCGPSGTSGRRCTVAALPCDSPCPRRRTGTYAIHRTFGGTAWVWLNDPRDEEPVAATLTALPGIEAVLTRGDAARRFRLYRRRIGDLVVLGDVSTVFGDLPPGTESEALPVTYRSHGSLYERRVPLVAYNHQTLPYTSMPRYNKDLLQPLAGNWLRTLKAGLRRRDHGQEQAGDCAHRARAELSSCRRG